MAKECHHMFKLLIIGDSGVGKSSLMERFAGNTFSDSHMTTIGVDFKLKTIDVDGQRVKLQLWDTAGQDRFRTITQSYYRNAHGVIVVYDVTDGKTFASVKRWLKETDDRCHDVVDRVLVGNKIDDSHRVIDSDEAQRYAEEIGIKLFETSAKHDINVAEMFVCITRMALKRKREQNYELKSAKDNVHEDSDHRRGHEKCC